ncbi:hypothetical protein BHE90_013002 [Fusarium euwallaceae]|uniref:Uncharacterized protein n=2 Tax=Fusarium solani species complex TaxID=232080 RepID=A0A430L9Z0_9HYPO|nr:hypothetical protein CDV31_011855 [Fusarium ambrosium]RTE72567.1 hypothetical protein BHE90_013002 [Fusarium euwallaceae]
MLFLTSRYLTTFDSRGECRNTREECSHQGPRTIICSGLGLPLGVPVTSHSTLVASGEETREAGGRQEKKERGHRPRDAKEGTDASETGRPIARQKRELQPTGKPKGHRGIP